MNRRPRPLVVTTALPSLTALLGAGLMPGCKPGDGPTQNPPPPRETDAGARPLPPVEVDPDHLPPRPSGGIAPVRPTPPAPSATPMGALGLDPSSAAPAAAMPGAVAPSPAAAVANAEAAQRAWAAAPRARAMIVHNHPPGTPCTPIDPEALRRAVQGGR
ncbi:MAG: hypothetical protein U0325_27840 [Polyangiales bacterium]